MLQSSRLEYHMKTIGIDQSLCKRSSFEHKCMNNTQKRYKHAGKCDDQHNLKDIIDAARVSTPKGFTDNSNNVSMMSTPVKNQVLGNHCVYSPTYWMLNQKTAKRRIVSVKSKCIATKVGTSQWTNKIKQKGHPKINEWIKCNLYAWITCHPQVVLSPISNDCLKVVLDDQSEPQLVTKILFWVSVREHIIAL